MKHTFLLLACALVACGGDPNDPATTDGGSDSRAESAPAEDTTPLGDSGPAGDTGATDGSATATFADVYTKVLQGSCSGGYCHGSGAGGWTFTIDRAATYAQLVGPGSTKCSGLKRVTPGEPDKSALFIKLRGSFSGMCSGDQMPPGGPMLAPADLELVRSWIAGGAKP